MKILALDLGKFNRQLPVRNQDSLYRVLDLCHQSALSAHDTGEVPAGPGGFESCSISGWVHDLCSECGLKTLVADPNQEAWKWRNVKRKTDRDDAQKLARLAALGQLVSVHIPAQPTREHRWLVKYRKTLVGRSPKPESRPNLAKNSICTKVQKSAMLLPRRPSGR
jgi:hypothetical protein